MGEILGKLILVVFVLAAASVAVTRLESVFGRLVDDITGTGQDTISPEDRDEPLWQTPRGAD